MKKKLYIKPESIIVPYYEPLMEQIIDGSTGTEESFAKEHDVFFDEDNAEDVNLWDFTPFEEESGTED